MTLSRLRSLRVIAFIASFFVASLSQAQTQVVYPDWQL